MRNIKRHIILFSFLGIYVLVCLNKPITSVLHTVSHLVSEVSSHSIEAKKTHHHHSHHHSSLKKRNTKESHKHAVIDLFKSYFGESNPVPNQEQKQLKKDTEKHLSRYVNLSSMFMYVQPYFIVHFPLDGKLSKGHTYIVSPPPEILS